MTTASEFQALLAHPEGVRVEFKEAKGSFHFEELLGQRIAVEEYHDDGKRVLLVRIPPRLPGTAWQYKGSYWMRAGDALVPMSDGELRRIHARTGPDFLGRDLPRRADRGSRHDRNRSAARRITWRNEGRALVRGWPKTQFHPMKTQFRRNRNSKCLSSKDFPWEQSKVKKGMGAREDPNQNGHPGAQPTAASDTTEWWIRVVLGIVKTRAAVKDRLIKEITYWDHRAEQFKLQERAGKAGARLNSQEARLQFLDIGAHRVQYLRRPFQREPAFGVTSINCDFADLVARAGEPS